MSANNDEGCRNAEISPQSEEKSGFHVPKCLFQDSLHRLTERRGIWSDKSTAPLLVQGTQEMLPHNSKTTVDETLFLCVLKYKYA